MVRLVATILAFHYSLQSFRQEEKVVEQLKADASEKKSHAQIYIRSFPISSFPGIYMYCVYSHNFLYRRSNSFYTWYFTSVLFLTRIFYIFQDWNRSPSIWKRWRLTSDTSFIIYVNFIINRIRGCNRSKSL